MPLVLHMGVEELGKLESEKFCKQSFELRKVFLFDYISKPHPDKILPTDVNETKINHICEKIPTHHLRSNSVIYLATDESQFNLHHG